MKLRLILLIVLMQIFFVSCDNDSKIDEEKFIGFYADMSLAADTIGFDTESLKNIRLKLHEKYGTNEKMFNNTLKYFHDDPKRWDTFFTKVMDKLESERKLISSTP